ncbi:hypothetical protein QMY54_05025 [Pseudomonas rhodesiae]|nr:hypothetical protein QMY54_05025 [Pseudomonas rhodesiae]
MKIWLKYWIVSCDTTENIIKTHIIIEEIINCHIKTIDFLNKPNRFYLNIFISRNPEIFKIIIWLSSLYCLIFNFFNRRSEFFSFFNRSLYHFFFNHLSRLLSFNHWRIWCWHVFYNISLFQNNACVVISSS